MKYLRNRWMAGLCAILFGTVLVTGCSRQPAADAGKGTIKLAYVNWAEGVAVTHLLDALLQDMGYQVKLTMADVAPIYTSVAQGDQDVMVETWLPVTHESYYERYGDKVELIGTWFESALIGLVVPSYVEIDSIDQLPSVKDRLKGTLTGIDSGAGIMSATERAIEAYDLDYSLLSSSGPAMTAALKSAVDSGDWIVVTGWAPHWMFARYDLKFLADPKGVFGAAEQIHAAARLGFSEEYPDAANLLRNMKFDGVQIASLMDAMEGAGRETESAVREWISAHDALVQSWLK